MAEKKTTPVTIDGKEYVFEDMTQEQQTLVNHIADLDRKISSTTFNLDQLKVGQQAFIQLLKESLEKQPETVQ
jgi:uncharacterized protein YlzI (FlbEa/FlbD family)